MEKVIFKKSIGEFKKGEIYNYLHEDEEYFYVEIPNSIEGHVSKIKKEIVEIYKNKRFNLQVVCNTQEEREQLKKALLILKSKTGERTAKSLIKYFEEVK